MDVTSVPYSQLVCMSRRVRGIRSGRRHPYILYCESLLAILVVYFANSLPGMVLGYCLIQFGVTWGYISAYVVSAEILPTRLRASGLGVSVAFGRVGAMITPGLLTSAFTSTGTPSAPMLVLLVLAAPGPLAAAAWWLKGRETRNVSLEQGSADTLLEERDDDLPLGVATR